ncbi:uncharacterized protein BCR38DRAFT_447892 [Pseudomassariella vexata]|uniref:EGF domain-specific O-linked N-acetylglucosamine transferase n=1 Tax=Pseudomassariella vexata TaxID=1141098 RepID=A0A1Y2DG59_9PEZI|nr:uncharacterized protein BCR38DRAFT_447892 [Pseudomassariella vexata]ORY58064.1 hypothetical protein BCR38DRAFT_447892 [Pseudomassariella vexata]
MIYQLLFTRRHFTTVLSSLLISVFLLGVLNTFQHGHVRSSMWPGQKLGFDDNHGNEETVDTMIPLEPLQPPNDYQVVVDEPLPCPRRLQTAYLEELRQSRAAYCSAESPSQLTCFHSQKSDSTIDSFCVGEHGVLGTKGKFELSCEEIVPYTIEANETAQTLDMLKSYWYETGPRVVFDQYVEAKKGELALSSPPELKSQEDDESAPSYPTNSNHYSILLKREGSVNLWHCLMEIMSLSMTLDVLQMTRQRGSADTMLKPADAPNTQVIVLDDKENGPFFDLWGLFAQKPTIRLAEVPAGTDMGTLIIPLAGASNPVWQDDWEPNNCVHSSLLETFSRRVLRYLHVWDADKEQEKDKIVVTFIDRRSGRRLVDQEKLVAALERRYADSPVRLEVHLVDFAAIPFAQQVQLVRDSDVLAGVHGAGLTHTLWLREPSAVVEILPEGFMHKGFRNLAGALGHEYFSTHGNVPASDVTGDSDGGRIRRRKGDWHTEDVALDEERFVELMDISIKSRFNSGSHNFDVN